MATDPPRRPYTRPRVTLAWCHTCNARERVIQHGKCIVCGNSPDVQPVQTSRQTTDPSMVFMEEMVDDATLDEFFDDAGPMMIVGPNDPPLDDWHDWHARGYVDWPEWTWLDRYVLVLCILATLYVVVQVVRWVM